MEMRKNRRQTGKRNFQREWVAALFGLLMATALPALVAMWIAPAGAVQAAALGEETAVQIYRHGGEEGEVLTLEEVLALSLAATNASDTPSAAWEAQAVALRSRSLWWMDYCGEFQGEYGESAGTPPLHTLCDSPTHGLPYRSREELVTVLGREELDGRMVLAEAAVRQTRGQVLTYEGEVIPALLHTESGGKTRSVESLAWTRSVNTPEAATVTVWRVDAEEARAILAADFGVRLSADPSEWGIEAVKAEAQTLAVRIGEEEISATVFAAALGLPSGDLTVETGKGILVITCTGQGSGCGLSRAGAAIYARGGLCYREILAHYYPDCGIEQAWE